MPAARRPQGARGTRSADPDAGSREAHQLLGSLHALVTQASDASDLHDFLRLALKTVRTATSAVGAAISMSRHPGGALTTASGKLGPATARITFPIRARGALLGKLEVSFPAGADRARRRGAPLVTKAERLHLEILASALGLFVERSLLLAAAAQARDEERARFARELHDGVAQGIGAAKLELERLSATDPSGDLLPVGERLKALFQEVRALAHALRPPALETLGLRGALEKLALDLERRVSTRATLVVHGPPTPLPQDLEWHLYRIAEEAIANVARHARASSASIEISYAPNALKLSICDDGRGFEPPEKAGDLGTSAAGLHTIRERARALGARLTVHSHPGHGTRIEVLVHVRRDEPRSLDLEKPQAGRVE